MSNKDQAPQILIPTISGLRRKQHKAIKDLRRIGYHPILHKGVIYLEESEYLQISESFSEFPDKLVPFKAATSTATGRARLNNFPKG